MHELSIHTAPPLAVARGPRLRWRPTPRAVVGTLLVLALLAVPLAVALGAPAFYLTLATRILVLGLAALGLNLILGFGGLVSMGHALYFGLGAYAVAMLASHGLYSGPLQLAAALGVGAAVATVVGAVCLRTGGMGFIMITLAFGQMFQSLAVGLKAYGGDDGLPIAQRSRWPGLSLDDPLALYAVALAVLGVALWAGHRLVHARFGMLLRGCGANLRRMQALGFATRRYQLAAYVISALVCVVAGMLFANLTRIASPSYLGWTLSGEFIAMIVLGGAATLVGPVLGAALWVLVEELLTAWPVPLPGGADALLREHWPLLFGALIVAATLGLKHGLYGALLVNGREEGHK